MVSVLKNDNFPPHTYSVSKHGSGIVQNFCWNNCGSLLASISKVITVYLIASSVVG